MSQIWIGYNDVTNVTGISYENAKTRVLCVSPLTTAKLTPSCADPNPGAIKYIQFTTDIALEVNERCKQLALEYHKSDKMRTPNARDAGCHAKTSVTLRRGSHKGCPRACICLLGQRRARVALVLPAQRPRSHPCACPMGLKCPTKMAIFVSASGGNETNETPSRYRKMCSSYNRCLIRTRNSYDSGHTLTQSGTKAGHKVPSRYTHS